MTNCIIICQQFRCQTEDMNQSSNSIKNSNKIRNRHPILRVRNWKGMCQYNSNVTDNSAKNVFFIKIILDFIVEKEHKAPVSTDETCLK